MLVAILFSINKALNENSGKNSSPHFSYFFLLNGAFIITPRSLKLLCKDSLFLPPFLDFPRTI